jgi:hypothetical protein
MVFEAQMYLTAVCIALEPGHPKRGRALRQISYGINDT